MLTNSNGTAISKPAKLVSRSDWMHDLGDDIGNVPLTELTIPGTHDTGTYGVREGTISKDHQTTLCEHYISENVCASYARAQSRNITQELGDGIRYFDIRACGEGYLPADVNPPDFVAISADPVTCHQVKAAPISDILQQTRAFVDLHPTEVVILDFNHEYQVDLDTLAGQIENAFKVDGPGNKSLLVPPQYCDGDPTHGTCAADLTLNKIVNQGLGNVIVNFMNDGTPGQERCFNSDDDPTWHYCDTQYHAQHGTMPSFYYIHPLLWGLTFSGLTEMANCTVGGAETTCFGNDSNDMTVLGRVQDQTTNRQTFAEPHPANHFEHFYVQFLQTTPDGGYIAKHLDGSLLDDAKQSNPVIGPAFFGCPSSWSSVNCYAPTRPENMNIVALNFYDVTDYTGWGGDDHFDFVREVLSFNEYARTAPVVTVNSDARPTAGGWYNAAALGGTGKQLTMSVSAVDYRYATGINAIACQDVRGTAYPLNNVSSGAISMVGNLAFGEGSYALTCTAEDGATSGTHGYGNSGGGPGSTNFPQTINVDTVPPQVHCPANANYVLNQPVTNMATVTDDNSGVAGSISSQVVTDTVGTFTNSVSAADVAGNAVTVNCTYTVSYAVGLHYDSTRLRKSGSTVPVKIELDNAAGANVSSPAIGLVATSITNLATGAKTVPTHPGNSTSQTFRLVKHESDDEDSATDAASWRYKYPLKTNGLASGNYTLDFTVAGDPSTHHVAFIIR